jgi:broad specificity phosphatase PhoE
VTLYVCRHGRTEANASGLLLGRANPELDHIGREQAAAIAAAIPQAATVISSPLDRCMQTAERFGQPITVDERFIELDYGEFDLKPLADVPPEVWASWRSDADFRPPGGETFNELAARVNAGLDDLREQAIDHDVVVVSHVSPIKAALAWALDCSISISWRSFVAQAAIMEIGVSKTGPSLRLFNGVAHLAAVDNGGSSAGKTGAS